jgi:hypothetical protein
MLQLIMLLMLLPQEPPATAQEVTPPPPPPEYDKGPMQAELLAMREVRLRMVVGEARPGFESDLRMQFRISGEKLPDVSRFGNFILTELVDDTGHALVDDDTYTDSEKEFTRANTIPPERLRQQGLLLTTRCGPASRGATALKTLRGYARLILATETESITIANPLQHYDEMIESEALKELGIQVRVVPFDEFETPPPQNRSIAIEYVSKASNIRAAKFVDGWMRPVRAPERKMATKDGVNCTVFTIDPSALNNELQLVLEVHPDVKDIKVEFEADDVELP